MLCLLILISCALLALAFQAGAYSALAIEFRKKKKREKKGEIFMRNANTKMQGLTLQRPSPKKAEMAPKSQNEGKFD